MVDYILREYGFEALQPAQATPGATMLAEKLDMSPDDSWGVIDYSIFAIDNACRNMGWKWRVVERTGTFAKVETWKLKLSGAEPAVDISINVAPLECRAVARVGILYPVERASVKTECSMFMNAVKHEIGNLEYFAKMRVTPQPDADADATTQSFAEDAGRSFAATFLRKSVTCAR